jgi:acetyl coenzyme A synthetase (ADP forming)-like protein
MPLLVEAETESLHLDDVVLRDGSTLALRAASKTDVPALVGFFAGLSRESRYFRFLGSPKLDEAAVERLLPPDRAHGYALVGECAGRIVAFAGYNRSPGADRAEVAFAVADGLQGRGVGTRLLEHLAEVARLEGIRAFDANVLGENRKMLRVFYDSGFAVSGRTESGVYSGELSLEVTPGFAERSAERAELAATASMRSFFEPKVVAVVGANRERGGIGAEILHNLLATRFNGTVVPVHPTAKEVQGLAAYARVSEVPGPVDLAVIAVPAARVLEVVDDCLAKGVRALCVISAGFSEAGPEGRAREQALLEKVRTAGCRLVGPNCLGLLNTDPEVRLNATFSPVYPPAGGVAMSTQSGALGLAILDYARKLHIGISSFVSVGNKADVSGNDLIQFWAHDPRTSVILLYLESFGNPKKFGEIARRVSRTKPIVAVKAGRSSSGARAAQSHTGALAVPDSVVDGLFRQAGVIRTDTLDQMFDVAALLAHQPVPKGRRVAILTNAGGPAILAADACEANGLELPALSEATRDELRSFLPASASVGNPVDMLAQAPAGHYRRALAALLRDDAIDSVVVIFIPPLVTDAADVARAIAEAALDAREKTIVGVFMSSQGAPSVLEGVPCHDFPEPAAIALARVTEYGQWKGRPAGTVPVLSGIRGSDAKQVVARALARGGGWLTVDESQALLEAVSIPIAAARRTGVSADEAVVAAGAIGFPVVVKGLGPSLLHKTESGAVHLDLADEQAVRDAVRDLEVRLRDQLDGLLVQAMVPRGVEMLVGAVQDPTFGPLVVCGAGGVLVDLLADSAFRLHPVTAEDATEMIGELRAARLLRGYRGSRPADERALRDVVLRVSALCEICPEIQELDLNPVTVLSDRAVAVDVRIRVERGAVKPRTRRVQY